MSKREKNRKEVEELEDAIVRLLNENVFHRSRCLLEWFECTLSLRSHSIASAVNGWIVCALNLLVICTIF